MRYIYFLQARRGGSNLIKIGSTGACPYHRLEAIRHLKPKEKIELLGAIESPDELNPTMTRIEREIQTQFSDLREEGEWFKPGQKLISFIKENARIHICRRQCPHGSCVEEEMRALDDRASASFQKAITSDD